MHQRFSGAIGMFTITTLLAPPMIAEEPRPSPEARVHFKAGVAALKNSQWNKAYRAFKDAYAITPRWTILGNLGIAAQHLERDGEAIDAMDQYLKRGKKEVSAAEKAEVRETIELLRAGTAEVKLIAPGSFSVVDIRAAEPEVVNEYGPFEDQANLMVRAGEHTFRIEEARAAMPAWNVTLLAGDAATHTFVTEPEPQPPLEAGGESTSALEQPGNPEQASDDVVTPSHAASYILWSLGGAGAAAATLIGLRAQGLQKDADRIFHEQCPFGATGSGECVNITDDSKQAAHWRTAGLITGLGALGALVTGTVLYISASNSTGSRANSSEASMRPWASASRFGLVGTF